MVSEDQILTMVEIRRVSALLAGGTAKHVRVLINRQNRYVHTEDYLILDLGSVDGVQIDRVAYFAPRTRDQIFSQVVSSTALRGVPRRIFSDRDEAVEWLLRTE
jgi:hypothetical protein